MLEHLLIVTYPESISVCEGNFSYNFLYFRFVLSLPYVVGPRVTAS